MELLELILGIPAWLMEYAWPVARTLGPWLWDHPWAMAPLGLLTSILWGFGTVLKSRNGVVKDLGLNTAVKWAAILVALIFIARNWPIVSGWLKRLTLVVVAIVWVLILWLVPSVRWTLFPTGWLAIVVPTIRWAEWTGGKWFSRDAYEAARERDQWMFGIRSGVRAMYPGSDPKILPGLSGDPFGFTVAFMPGTGQTVGGLDTDAQSGAIGGSIYRQGRKVGLPVPPQAVRVLPGSHEGMAQLRVDTHGLTGFNKVVKCPPYKMT